MGLLDAGSVPARAPAASGAAAGAPRGRWFMLSRCMVDPQLQNLHVTRADAVATLTLDRPKALNALDAATLRELARAIRELRRDGGVRALVVTGAGDKAFSAGADIAAMAAMSAAEEAAKVAAELAAKAPVALAQAKRATAIAADADLETGCRFEVEAFGVTFATGDRVEGLKAFLEKRTPAWKGR